MKGNVLNQINKITSKLIELNLSSNQQFPSEKDGIIYISGNPDLSIALKNISYSEIYDTLNKDKNYNIKMIDGALIQLMYSFKANGDLKKYRLAFFPSPNLDEFQNNWELYELDEIYADIIGKNIVTTPIRFDYDPSNFEAIEHPCSHLTIGQYKNCRIPLSAPLTPVIFIEFILRNFYNTAHNKYSKKFNFKNEVSFASCIDDLETKILHLSINPN
jgi:hypothetical protein